MGNSLGWISDRCDCLCISSRFRSKGCKNVSRHWARNWRSQQWRYNASDGKILFWRCISPSLVVSFTLWLLGPVISFFSFINCSSSPCYLESPLYQFWSRVLNSPFNSLLTRSDTCRLHLRGCCWFPFLCSWWELLLVLLFIPDHLLSCKWPDTPCMLSSVSPTFGMMQRASYFLLYFAAFMQLSLQRWFTLDRGSWRSCGPP